MLHNIPTEEDSGERCVPTLDQFFARNYNKFATHCNLKYNGSGEELCHVVIETLVQKEQSGEFIHLSDVKTWKWLTVTLKKSARKVIGFKKEKKSEIEKKRKEAESNAGWGTAWNFTEGSTVSLEEIREHGWEPSVYQDPAPAIDARKMIMRMHAMLSDERCKHVIKEVITNDADTSVVCRSLGLNYTTFRLRCRKALEKPRTKKA